MKSSKVPAPAGGRATTSTLSTSSSKSRASSTPAALLVDVVVKDREEGLKNALTLGEVDDILRDCHSSSIKIGKDKDKVTLLTIAESDEVLKKIGEKLLLYSAVKNRNDNLRYALSLDPAPDVNFRCPYDTLGDGSWLGFSALHLSAINNNAEAVKILIDFGADRNMESNDKYTALELATKNKSKESVQLLTNYFPVKIKMISSQLDCKLRIDALLNNNRYNQVRVDFKYMQADYLPMLMQLRFPNLCNIVKSCDNTELLEEEFFLMETDESLLISMQEKAIHYLISLACAEGQLDALDFLLDKSPSYDGYPGLYDAISNNHPCIVERLVTLPGIDINRGQKGVLAPLSYAVLQFNLEICKILLESGADVDAFNPDVITNNAKGPGLSAESPLHIAINLRNVPLCRLLIVEGKANVNCLDTCNRTPILSLIQKINQFSLEEINILVGILLENGADAIFSSFGHGFDHDYMSPHVHHDQEIAIMNELVNLKHVRYTRVIEMLTYSGLDTAYISVQENPLIKEVAGRAFILGIFAALYFNYVYLDISDLRDLVDLINLKI